MTGGQWVGRLQTRAGILRNTDIMMPQTAPVIEGVRFSWRSEISLKSCCETSQLLCTKLCLLDDIYESQH